MKQIITNDSSVTFHSERYDETYHSTTGAEEEAIKKFAEPTRELIIKQCNTKKEINILKICFRLEKNSTTEIDEIKKNKKRRKLPGKTPQYKLKLRQPKQKTPNYQK